MADLTKREERDKLRTVLSGSDYWWPAGFIDLLDAADTLQRERDRAVQQAEDNYRHYCERTKELSEALDALAALVEGQPEGEWEDSFELETSLIHGRLQKARDVLRRANRLP